MYQSPCVFNHGETKIQWSISYISHSLSAKKILIEKNSKTVDGQWKVQVHFCVVGRKSAGVAFFSFSILPPAGEVMTFKDEKSGDIKYLVILLFPPKCVATACDQRFELINDYQFHCFCFLESAFREALRHFIKSKNFTFLDCEVFG